MIGIFNSKQRGVTLIELLIVVAVIGVLSAVALPMYRDFVVRSNRSDAIISLTELANLQEKHFSNELQYANDVSDLSYPSTSPNDLYSLAVTVSTTVSYTLTATPLGQQLADDDTCQVFRLNGLGQRSAEDDDGNNTTQTCWNR